MPNPAFQKLHLSGSTDGRNILIRQTATPGTTIHTATSSSNTDSYDEVWVWASSAATSSTNATIQTSETDDQASINFRVPAAYNGPILVIPGWVYRNGVVLTATAAVTSHGVILSGFVNRISGN